MLTINYLHEYNFQWCHNILLSKFSINYLTLSCFRLLNKFTFLAIKDDDAKSIFK